jgi:hypothetical protein
LNCHFLSCHFLGCHFLNCNFLCCQFQWTSHQSCCGSRLRVGRHSVQAEWAVRSGRCLEILLAVAIMQVSASSFPSPASPSPRWPLIRSSANTFCRATSSPYRQVQSAKEEGAGLSWYREQACPARGASLNR